MLETPPAKELASPALIAARVWAGVNALTGLLFAASNAGAWTGVLSFVSFFLQSVLGLLLALAVAVLGLIELLGRRAWLPAVLWVLSTAAGVVATGFLLAETFSDGDDSPDLDQLNVVARGAGVVALSMVFLLLAGYLIGRRVQLRRQTGVALVVLVGAFAVLHLLSRPDVTVVNDTKATVSLEYCSQQHCAGHAQRLAPGAHRRLHLGPVDPDTPDSVRATTSGSVTCQLVDRDDEERHQRLRVSGFDAETC